MPNWVVGQARFKGRESAIVCLVQDWLGYYDCDSIIATDESLHHPDLKIEKQDGWMTITTGFKDLEVVGLYRCHATDCDYIYACEYDDGDYVMAIELHCAWGFDTNQLVNMCKKARVDLRMTAFDSGMCKVQDIEIKDGVLITNNVIEYNARDWMWDTICPLTGG